MSGSCTDPTLQVDERDGTIGALGLQRFEELRKLVFRGIALYLEEESHCKSYEGAFEIEAPNWFEARERNTRGFFWIVRLHCYVIGPSRHHTWTGNSLAAACEMAIVEVNGWIAHLIAERKSSHAP